MAKKNKKLTVITIRSDEINAKLLKTMKKQFKKSLPKNHKIAIIGVGSNDAVSVDTVEL